MILYHPFVIRFSKFSKNYLNHEINIYFYLSTGTNISLVVEPL
jgi:hypothetical protein